MWRDFQARVAAGAAWNSETFIATAQQRTDARTASFLRAVVEARPANPGELLLQGLGQAGWNVAPAKHASP